MYYQNPTDFCKIQNNSGIDRNEISNYSGPEIKNEYAWFRISYKRKSYLINRLKVL